MVKFILAVLCLLSVLSLAAFGQEFDEDGFLVIKADPELPLALVTLTRARPNFVSMGIEKDASTIPMAFEREVIAPSETELMPEKIEKLSLLLQKERL